MQADKPAWRVAVVGAGPSAFYTAEALLKLGQNVQVDLLAGRIEVFLTTPASVAQYINKIGRAHV